MPSSYVVRGQTCYSYGIGCPSNARVQLDVEVTLRVYLTLGVLLGIQSSGINSNHYRGSGTGFTIEVGPPPTRTVSRPSASITASLIFGGA